MAQRKIAHQQMQSLITSVFGWMSGALVMTGILAYSVAAVPQVAAFINGNPLIILTLFIVQLALVYTLSANLRSLSVETASICFWVYAALTGVTLSGIFLVYTQLSIASAFFTAAGMFGVMALYGATTNADLTRMGHYLVMALVGLIIAQLVNFFLGNTQLDIAISLIGVLIFAGLTAYDMQYLRRLAQDVDGEEEATKVTILMSLKLYLDFLNLFLFLLRLMGTRRR